MVVETLTFRVDPSERAQWLEVEEQVWSRFLEAQPGFVRKEMWVDETDGGHVHAVIWWRSLDEWHAISPTTVAEVDARMGEWFREPRMRSFNVVREC